MQEICQTVFYQINLIYFNCKLDYYLSHLYIISERRLEICTMFGKGLRKNRQFSFKPYYYQPEKDKTKKRRIEFKRKSRRKAAKQKSLISLIILLSIIIYIIYILNNLGK